MDNITFCEKLWDVAEDFNTVYMKGVFGAPVNEYTISSKARQYPTWYTPAKQAELKKLIGKLSDIRGNEFNSVVYQKLNSIDGLIVRERLSKVNGKKITDENGNVLGDIDVFYIVPEKRKIVVGEVKDFSFAKSPYEMDQEYKRIFVD